MRIVLETNVLISALIKQGKPRNLLTAIIDGKHQLITSEEILTELAQVANNARIRKYVTRQDVADYIRDIASVSEIVHIVSEFQVIEEDPDDDAILQTAYDSGAGYIVSGDRHLLELERFERIHILTVEEMLKIV
jgi:putative PIN family toxin of toxin-antitoxin system